MVAHGLYCKHHLQQDILLSVSTYLARVEYRVINDGMLHSDVKALSQLSVHGDTSWLIKREVRNPKM